MTSEKIEKLVDPNAIPGYPALQRITVRLTKAEDVCKALNVYLDQNDLFDDRRDLLAAYDAWAATVERK